MDYNNINFSNQQTENTQSNVIYLDPHETALIISIENAISIWNGFHNRMHDFDKAVTNVLSQELRKATSLEMGEELDYDCLNAHYTTCNALIFSEIFPTSYNHFSELYNNYFQFFRNILESKDSGKYNDAHFGRIPVIMKDRFTCIPPHIIRSIMSNARDNDNDHPMEFSTLFSIGIIDYHNSVMPKDRRIRSNDNPTRERLFSEHMLCNAYIALDQLAKAELELRNHTNSNYDPYIDINALVNDPALRALGEYDPRLEVSASNDSASVHHQSVNREFDNYVNLRNTNNENVNASLEHEIYGVIKLLDDILEKEVGILNEISLTQNQNAHQQR